MDSKCDIYQSYSIEQSADILLIPDSYSIKYVPKTYLIERNTMDDLGSLILPMQGTLRSKTFSEQNHDCWVFFQKAATNI